MPLPRHTRERDSELPRRGAGGRANPRPVPRPGCPHTLARFHDQPGDGPTEPPHLLRTPPAWGWGGRGLSSPSCRQGCRWVIPEAGTRGQAGAWACEVTDRHCPWCTGSMGWHWCARRQGSGGGVLPAPGLQSHTDAQTHRERSWSPAGCARVTPVQRLSPPGGRSVTDLRSNSKPEF